MGRGGRARHVSMNWAASRCIERPNRPRHVEVYTESHLRQPMNLKWHPSGGPVESAVSRDVFHPPVLDFAPYPLHLHCTSFLALCRSLLGPSPVHSVLQFKGSRVPGHLLPPLSFFKCGIISSRSLRDFRASNQKPHNLAWDIHDQSVGQVTFMAIATNLCSTHCASVPLLRQQSHTSAWSFGLHSSRLDSSA